MKRKRNDVIYYTDELQEEFSTAQIIPRVIDENYPYFHGKLWDCISLLCQNLFSMPIKFLYAKGKFHWKVVGKEKLKINKNNGYFIYGNHTQPFADTFLPSLVNFPKRNFFIVNPENISMPGLGKLVELLGAIPVPGNFSAMKNFMRAVEEKIKRNYSVTIYPEAHIWPYYTKIRPFQEVSFRYPVTLECPVYALTNTYHKRKGNEKKVDMITYIDGPFFPIPGLNKKEQQKNLRNQVYQAMVERSKESDFEMFQYKRLPANVKM